MRYPGSKRRIASALRDVIFAHKGDRDIYIEPFVGGANSFTRIAPLFEHALGMDNNADLIALYKAVQEGWEPMHLNITPEVYAQTRDFAGDYSAAWRGFVGVGASYGGKWFGGHAHGGFNADGTPRNHAAESWRALQLQARIWAQCDVAFALADYTSLRMPTPERCVIYCDPPYKGDVGHPPYPYSTWDFDYERYYTWLQGISNTDALVVCSERTMPYPWQPVYKECIGSSSLQAAETRVGLTDTIWML